MNIYFERLKEYWKSKDCKNANQFAKTINNERSENINRLRRNDNALPGIDLIMDIIKKYPDFDVNKFLKGTKGKKDNELAASEPPPPKYKIKCTNPECLAIIADLESKNNAYKEMIREIALGKEKPPEKHAEGGVEKRGRNAG